MNHNADSSAFAYIDSELTITKTATAFANDDAVGAPELTNLLLLSIARSLDSIEELLAAIQAR